jgi:hypothetical protein
VSKCTLCIAQGWPSNFGDEPRCAFETGEFSSENWNCATAVAIRMLMGEGWDDSKTHDNFYVRRDDQSYGALFVPPHPEDIPEGKQVGPWRGGGLIAGYWYKHRSQTEMLIRVDPRNGGKEPEAAKRLTVQEAEAAIENCCLAGISIAEDEGDC